MRWSTVALVSEQMLRDLRKWFAVAKLGGIGVMHGAGALDAVAALLPDYEFEPTVMQVDIYMGNFYLTLTASALALLFVSFVLALTLL